MNRSRLASALLVALFFTPSLLAGGRCSLEHYPVAVGDVNEYQMTSAQFDADHAAVETTSLTYRDEVTAVEEDRYRTKTTNDSNVSESDWVCTREGIELQIGEFPDTKITTTGMTVPAEMEVGGNWVQTFVSETAGFTQTSKTVNRITAREKVVVPAGTFDAFRVDYVIETTFTGQEPSFARGTQWYAPGTGIVKSTSVIDMQGEIRTVETTIELVTRTSR